LQSISRGSGPAFPPTRRNGLPVRGRCSSSSPSWRERGTGAGTRPRASVGRRPSLPPRRRDRARLHPAAGTQPRAGLRDRRCRARRSGPLSIRGRVRRAPVWPPTIATASSRRRTWRTPGIARALVSPTAASLPPSTGHQGMRSAVLRGDRDYALRVRRSPWGGTPENLDWRLPRSGHPPRRSTCGGRATGSRSWHASCDQRRSAADRIEPSLRRPPCR
jgi:hypothetical protein